MKREHGFSLIELLVATTIVTLILAATLGTLTSAINATQAITLMADTQENLRAGLNYMVRDVLQTGEGVPQGGITMPNTAGVSSMNRPGPGTPAVSFGTFPTTWTALPAIVSGFQQGATTTTSGVATDMVTVMYADTTLQDVNGHWLNEFPINLANTGTPGCAAGNGTPEPGGSIVTAGSTTTVTFDPTCIVINNGNTGINPGDLIMFQNNNTVGDGSQTGTDESVSDSSGSMALMTVSGVNPAANSISFSSNDAFNLNSSGATAGTLNQIKIQTGPKAGTYPTTTATRFWLITYYISTAAPASAAQPMLMRQVNMNQPQAVGEVIENMQIFYDILNAGSSPVTVTAAQENPTSAQLPDIRDAYIMLYARSQDPFNHTNRYFRNNLETVVSIRGLDFYNKFQ